MNPDTLGELYDELAGTTATTGYTQSVAAEALLVGTVSALFPVVGDKGSTPNKVVAPLDREAAAEAEDLRDSKQAYELYRNFSGRVVPLNRQARCVPTSIRELRESGYLSGWPSFGNTRTFGMIGNGKRKLELGRVGGEMAHITLDQATQKNLPDVESCRTFLPVPIDALGAVLCTQVIKKEAFGGHEDGWQRLPNTTKDVRLLLNPDVLDEFLWTLVGIRAKTVTDFGLIFDKVVGHFLIQLQKARVHPSTALSTIIATKPYLFETDAGSTSQGSDVSSVIFPEDSASGTGRGGKSVCLAWLTTGACKNPRCLPAAHPENWKGKVRGGSPQTNKPGGKGTGGTKRKPDSDAK